MACENCKYWKPAYASFLRKMVMECTKKDKDGKGGACKYFQRKEKTDG